MNMVIVRWTNIKGKKLKCQEFKLCAVTKISLSPSTIAMSSSSSSSSSPTWRMGLPQPRPPIRRTLSLIRARMAAAWVTARPVTRLAETKTVITISSPYHHHTIIMITKSTKITKIIIMIIIIIIVVSIIIIIMKLFKGTCQGHSRDWKTYVWPLRARGSAFLI